MRDGAVTPFDIASLATRLDVAALDEAVQAIPAEMVPLYLYMRDRAAMMLSALGKALTTRMILEGRIGETWTSPDGHEWRFENERRGEFRELGSLFSVLNRMGVSVTELGAAAQGARATDLEKAALALPPDRPDDPGRGEALAAIRDHRVWRDGSAKLVQQDSPYRKGGVQPRTSRR